MVPQRGCACSRFDDILGIRLFVMCLLLFRSGVEESTNASMGVRGLRRLLIQPGRASGKKMDDVTHVSHCGEV